MSTTNLSEGFRKAGLPNIAQLIEEVERKVRVGLIELGSATIVDERGILDPLTELLSERFGFPHTPSSFDPLFHERHKALRIGGVGTNQQVISPLEWFERLFEIHCDLPRESLEFFDSVAKSFAIVAAL